MTAVRHARDPYSLTTSVGTGVDYDVAVILEDQMSVATWITASPVVVVAYCVVAAVQDRRGPSAHFLRSRRAGDGRF